MEIVLEPMDPELWPTPENWIAVGRIGRYALAYGPARQPYLLVEDGPQPLDRDAVNAAMADAVDRAASKLWPGGWTIQFSTVFGVHRRSLLPDRLARQGLPPAVLRALGEMAVREAEGFGWMLMAIARYADAFASSPNPNERVEEALSAADRAGEALRRARLGKPGLREQRENKAFDDAEAAAAKEKAADPSTDTIP